MKTRILLVEDERLIGEMIRLNLREEGYEVEWETNGETALERLIAEDWDTVVLDVNLPGMSGFDVARNARNREIVTPILMLTVRSDTPSKVRGLDAGADDYLVKPFEVAELLARVRALIRRSQGERHLPAHRMVRMGSLWANLETRESMTNEGEAVLSEKEARLLELFVRHRGEVLNRADILEEVWGMEADPTLRTVDNFVMSLRRLFEPQPDRPRHFLTVRGQGYRFEL